MASEVPPQLQLEGGINNRAPTIFRTVIEYSENLKIAYIFHAFGVTLAIAGCWYIWNRTADVTARLITIFVGPILISPSFYGYDLVGLSVIFGLIAMEVWQQAKLSIHLIILAILLIFGYLTLSVGANYLGLGAVFVTVIMIYAIYRAKLDFSVER